MTIVGGADSFSRVEEYEVQPGDSLTQIAYKFKASQRQIRKINELLEDTIMPGEILLIPIREAPNHGDEVSVITETQDFKITHIPDVEKPLGVNTSDTAKELQQSSGASPGHDSAATTGNGDDPKSESITEE